MKTTNFLLATQKETPNDAEIISHKLMIRSGMIHKLASGLYSWLPLGLKVLQKVENIVREEMNKSGAQEVLMPVAQPAELWQQSKRWDLYGSALLRFQDRHNRDFCLGPTHEEVITNIASQYIKSYKQLPLNLYQIQTKFRDEIRPRFGVMRSREFIMKDAYSFHLDAESLQQTYDLMYQTYSNIFDRIGLKYRAVLADTGSIGGSHSHEFHVLSDSGEDLIAFSDKSDYAANIELAKTKKQEIKTDFKEEVKVIDTPNAKTIADVCNLLKISPKKTIKTLVVHGSKKDSLVALICRGDHNINEIKAVNHKDIASPINFATDDEISRKLGCDIGSIGVVDLKMPIIVDYAAAALIDFVCGANENDKHLTGVNWIRDVQDFTTSDLRNIVKGDESPDGKGKILLKRGIEVGHIFQLGTKYSKALNANVIGQNGKATTLTMGCYGIGVSRIVAAVIEQNHDEHGIIFPKTIAPFQLIILPINYHKSIRVKNLADDLYQKCINAGIEVLLDDRKERVGVMFNDAELIGIPHRLVISDSHVDNNTVEYKNRVEKEKAEINIDNAISFITKKTTA